MAQVAREMGSSTVVRSKWPRIAVAAAITVVATAATAALGHWIWPDPPGVASPPSSILPALIALDVAASLLFGLGICFLIFGYGVVARAGQPLVLTYATYISIAWLMVSWWPHGNLHRVTLAGNWSGLIGIEYGFHLTLMAAAAITAVFFLRVLSRPDAIR